MGPHQHHVWIWAGIYSTLTKGQLLVDSPGAAGLAANSVHLGLEVTNRRERELGFRLAAHQVSQAWLAYRMIAAAELRCGKQYTC